jgi:hypothetical protein
LLTVPSLPTPQQLEEIKERKEREERERVEEIERQMEEQRQKSAKREAEAADKSALSAELERAAADLTTEKIAQGFGKFTSDLDRLFSRETIKDISKELSSIMPGSTTKEEKAPLEKSAGPAKGWMCNPQAVMTSVDAEDDPFMMQRDQLLSFIAQAKQAKKYDEVRVLEESLAEIEAEMRAPQLSYGF